MAHHTLKVWPAYFEAIASGDKPFEVRWGDDRQYAERDGMDLCEWDPERGAYTGRTIGAWLTYAERVDPAQFGVAGSPPVWLLGLHVCGVFEDDALKAKKG